MHKFLQTTFKSIFALPTKIQLMNDLDQLRQENQELIADNSQLMAENDGLKLDKQKLIQENYRLSQNLTAALASIQDLQEQLIRYQSAQPEMPLSLDETFDSDDLVAIEQLVHEFN